jgi:hypothetical protein
MTWESALPPSLKQLRLDIGKHIEEIEGSKALGERMCPSSDRENATHVLGIRTDSDEVQFFDELLPLPQSALDVITLQDQHTRLRLTGSCIRSSCVHWKEGCSLGWAISKVSISAVIRSDDFNKHCPIETKCRWIAENGVSVCNACKEILNVPIFNQNRQAKND